ncbi:MAG: hypothetical protein NT168_07380, partial [Planctomycetota bacterium]|nr:hypothetical protein [Planctomycetota bacterium]
PSRTVPFVPGTGRGGEICQHSDSGIAKVPGTGRGGEICQHFDSGIAKVPGTNGSTNGTNGSTNGTVRLGSERKFSSGSWKFFVILPRALAIDDDFKNLPWLKSRTFLASAN